jgi:hypothetical protein
MGQNEGREGGRKWGPKTEKLRAENAKIGARKSKKMGPKIKKMGVGRAESAGRGGENGKKKNNK